jgi:hypothetical protein
MNLNEIDFIPTNREGRCAIVDIEDTAKVLGHGWQVHKSGHVRCTTTRGTAVYMHRLILDVPRGWSTDHINGNPLDNRKANLRVCTHAENMRNQRRHRDSKSGYKGVVLSKGRWSASITVSGRQKHLGRFDTSEEAARAYDAAARELHGAFARLNFPD